MEEDHLRAVIRAFLCARRKTSLSSSELYFAFKKEERRDFPYKKLGHDSFVDYLKSIPTVCKLSSYNSLNPKVYPVNRIDGLMSTQNCTPEKPMRSQDFRRSEPPIKGTYEGYTPRPPSPKPRAMPSYEPPQRKLSLQLQQLARNPLAEPAPKEEAVSILIPDFVCRLGTKIQLQALPEINGDAAPYKFLFEITVFVVEIFTPGEFYITLDSSSNNLKMLMEDLKLGRGLSAQPGDWSCRYDDDNDDDEAHEVELPRYPPRISPPKDEQSQLLRTFYKQAEKKFSIPLPFIIKGLYVAVELLGGGDWYRAQVIGSDNEGNIRVECIDFGTCKAVKPMQLRFLHKFFATLPAQAIRSKLCHVRPKNGAKTWPEFEENLELSTAVMEKRLIAHVLKISMDNPKGRLQLDMILYDTSESVTNPLVINDYVVEKGFAVYDASG